MLTARTAPKANPHTDPAALGVAVCALRPVWRSAAASVCVYSWSALAEPQGADSGGGG